MGYTTEFVGTFKLDKQLTLDQFNELEVIAETRGGETNDARPDSYCQWVPTKDGRELKWDGNEKFYNYVEWLQWLIGNKLRPWGIDITGHVLWRGDETYDVGVLSVSGGKVTARKTGPFEVVEGDQLQTARNALKAIAELADDCDRAVDMAKKALKEIG